VIRTLLHPGAALAGAALSLVLASSAHAETAADADAALATVKYVYKCPLSACPPGTVIRDHRGEGKTRILYCRYSGCRPSY
jgi:hypothetical protein